MTAPVSKETRRRTAAEPLVPAAGPACTRPRLPPPAPVSAPLLRLSLSRTTLPGPANSPSSPWRSPWSEVLPRLNSWGSTVTDRAPTSGWSPLVGGGVVGRASAAPDRDSGLHFPPREVRIPPPDSASQPMNTEPINVSPAVGFIPRLRLWAFASDHCHLETIVDAASAVATVSYTPPPAVCRRLSASVDSLIGSDTRCRARRASMNTVIRPGV